MSHFLNKQTLYNEINILRKNIGIKSDSYPINVISILKSKGLAEVEAIPFKTPGLKGMVSISSSKNEKDIILLNSHQNGEEQNFTCGHEFIHLMLHRNEKIKSFSCFDKIMPNQDSFLEWQANEGSAELEVPYRSLLEDVKENCQTFNDWRDYCVFKSQLATKYGVAEAVINYRFESLKYELHQYLNNIPMGSIEILSHNQQITCGINVKSLNDIENELFMQCFKLHK